MSFLKELFGTEKPIIGLLHLKPLPGDPFYTKRSSLYQVIDAARADLLALQGGGVDGVLMTNEFSVPYQQQVPAVTLGSMAYVAGALCDDVTVPFGVEAIYDPMATIEACAATGAAFTRCVFTDVWAGDLGLIDRDIASTLRRKHDLGLDDLKMFYFITSEGEQSLYPRTPAERIASLDFNCRPDAYVVGGTGPGQPVQPATLGELSTLAGGTPVVCGTGCNAQSAPQILANASGAFVGTSLKEGGRIENPVDRARVQAFMQVARSVREG